MDIQLLKINNKQLDDKALVITPNVLSSTTVTLLAQAVFRMNGIDGKFELPVNASAYDVILCNSEYYRIDKVTTVTQHHWSVDSSVWTNYVGKRNESSFRIEGMYSQLPLSALSREQQLRNAKLPEPHSYATVQADIGFNPMIAVRTANSWAGSSMGNLSNSKSDLRSPIKDTLKAIGTANSDTSLKGATALLSAIYSIPQSASQNNSISVTGDSAGNGTSQVKLDGTADIYGGYTSYFPMSYNSGSIVSQDWLRLLELGTSEDVEAWVDFFPQKDSTPGMGMMAGIFNEGGDFRQFSGSTWDDNQGAGAWTSHNLVDLSSLPIEAIKAGSIHWQIGQLETTIDLKNHISGTLVARVQHARQKDQNTRIIFAIGDDILGEVEAPVLPIEYGYTYLDDATVDYTNNMPSALKQMLAIAMTALSSLFQIEANGTFDIESFAKVVTDAGLAVIAGIMIASGAFSPVGWAIMIFVILGVAIMSTETGARVILMFINGDIYKEYGSQYAKGRKLTNVGRNKIAMIKTMLDNSEWKSKLIYSTYTSSESSMLNNLSLYSGFTLENPEYASIDWSTINGGGKLDTLISGNGNGVDRIPRLQLLTNGFHTTN